MQAKQLPFRQQIDAIYHQRVTEANTKQANNNKTIYTIPVVFHVVWNTSAPLQNLHDSVLLEQINVLNEDFGRMNADTNNLRPSFIPIVGNAQIQFELACVDPNGNPTNGIVRVPTTVTFGGGFIPNMSSIAKIQNTSQGGSDAWNTSEYLNIWVGDINGGNTPSLLGIATPPAGLSNWPANSIPPELTDGAIIQYSAFGEGTTANPIAINSGITGGIFSVLTSVFPVNPTTGELTLSAAVSGNYGVVYTVAQTGCQYRDTVAIAINPTSVFTQTFNECQGFSVMVGTSTYNTTGVYTNVLTGSNGCDSTVTTDLTINIVDITVANSSAPTLSANQVGATYQWLDCDNANAPISGEIGQTFTATVNGNYAVEITVGNCVDTSACENVTVVGIYPLSIGEGAGVRIYPNPTSGLFTINLTNSKEVVSYTITTIEGRIVKQTNNVTTNNIEVDLTNESKGVYFLIIQENSTNTTYKIVRQ